MAHLARRVMVGVTRRVVCKPLCYVGVCNMAMNVDPCATARGDPADHALIGACGAAHPSRPETWINEPIRKVFCDLHARGAAHSSECWDDKELIGGIYGLEIGGAFFGESMFSRKTDASKIALINLYPYAAGVAGNR